MAGRSMRLRGSGRKDVALFAVLAVLLGCSDETGIGHSASITEAGRQADDSAAARSTPTLAVLCEAVPSAAVVAVADECTRCLDASAKVTLLDRAYLDRVMTEHKMSVAAVVREPLLQGKMLGADYLVNVTDAGTDLVRACGLLCLEVASGNVVFEQMVPTPDGEVEAAARAMPQAVQELLAGIGANEADRAKPAAVVAAVLNKSASPRLEFLEDSLRGLLEDLLASRGYRLLRRNHPGLLAGETALGSLGLARPNAAVLAQVGDLVLTIAFRELPSTDLPFEQTPIHLDLEIKIKGQETVTEPMTFTLATMDELAAQLCRAIPDRVRPVNGGLVSEDDDVQRRIEAAKLLASLKDAPRLSLFLTDPDGECKQVEVAQRVVYLDPTAKEAYYHLARSMLSAMIQTSGWHSDKSQAGSWREVADAYHRYLSFPRTNISHASSAFGYELWCLPHLYKGEELVDRCMVLLCDYYRWTHEVNEKKMPYGRPDGVVGLYSRELEAYWDENPQKRLDFYAWLDRLYTDKPGLAVFPIETARAYDKLGQRTKAAEYLYDALITQKLGEIRLNSYITRPEQYAWARELADLLPEEKAAAIRARLDRRTGAERDRQIAWGGMQPREMGTNAGGVYGYSWHAEEIVLKGLDIKVIEPQPVPLPDPLRYSTVIRRTPSGLWVQGVLAATDSTEAGLGTGGSPSGPPRYRHRLAVYRSTEMGRWQPMNAPAELTSVQNEGNSNQANFIVSIGQAGSDVLFATRSGGLFVCDLIKGWRRVSLQEGLPVEGIGTLASGGDGRHVWLTGNRFLYQYKDGAIFLSPVRINRWCCSMAVAGNRIYTLGYEPDNLFLVDAAGRTTTVLDAAQQRQACRVPSWYCMAREHGFNAGDTLFRRILALDDRVFLVSQHGLHVLYPDGKPMRFWWAGTFAYWQELGVWIDGNCPLPPCALREVVQDDSDPHRLWLLSQDGYPMHDLRFAALGMTMSRRDDTHGQTFITAYDWQRDLFSKPLRINQACVVAAEPRGDYLYLTGDVLSRVPKTAWVVDQRGGAADAELRVRCPDPRVAEASLALFRGEFDRTREALGRLAESDLPASKIAAMRRALDKLVKAAETPQGTP
ncbi:MAG: hypothetical protein JXQ75_10545 [Phycisphaerae bacterium]|nr:hypothetical protein [Phycisphaerae bacterium]